MVSAKNSTTRWNILVGRRSSFASSYDAVTRIEQGRKQSLAGATKTRLSGNKFGRGVIEDKRTGTRVHGNTCSVWVQHAEGKEADENNVCTPVRTMETRRAKPPEPAGGRGSVIRAGCLVLTPSIGRCCNRRHSQPNYSRNFSYARETRSYELR